MSTQQTRDARARTGEQLAEDLESAHQSLFNLRFQSATRQLADNSQMRKAKKHIARLKTLVHERKIVAAHDQAVTALQVVAAGAGAVLNAGATSAAAAPDVATGNKE